MNDVKVLLLSASQWDFEDEKTGERRRGTTVYVCHVEDLTKNKLAGIKPVKYTLEFDAYAEMNNMGLPAYAVGQFVYDFTKGKLIPKYFDIVAPIDLGVLDGK